MRIVKEISIAAPHKLVWDLIDGDEARKLWIPDLVATTYPAGRPKSDPTGTRFRETLREGASIRSYAGEVAAHVEGRLRAVRLVDEHMSMDIEYRIGRGSAATSVRFAGVFLLSGLPPGSAMMGAARPVIEARITAGLERLKAVAEASPRA